MKPIHHYPKASPAPRISTVMVSMISKPPVAGHSPPAPVESDWLTGRGCGIAAICYARRYETYRCDKSPPDRERYCLRVHRLKALMDDQAVYRLFRHSDWLLADGAIGTNLFARGLPPGTAPERWNLDHPEQVTALHRAFVEAGADIILTNSFGANRRRLELLGETDVQSINLQAAQLAGGAAQSSERDVVIAGSIGPSGSLLQPYGELSRNEAEALFDEQARALAEGGVDCLWIETMAAGDELSAAFNAAAGTGLPVVCTFSFDMHGHTMMGLDVGAALDVIGELPQTPLALGANCGGGTLDTVEIIVQMHEQLDDSVPIVAKANCGQPRFHDGVIDYGKSPEHMAHYARLARDAGARIIGGCCGTGAQHLQAMSRALQDYRPQPYDGQQAQALLGE